jgi:hypothetical protein
LSFDFSNTATPSRTTSKRPPELGINVMAASGNRVASSAARPAARDS